MLDTTRFQAERSVADGVAGPLLSSTLTLVQNRLRVAGRRTSTQTQYMDDATAFIAWFEATWNRDPVVADLTVRNTDEYLLARESAADGRGAPWSAGTIGHYQANLRAFAGHLADACALPDNPLATKSAKAAKRPTRGRTERIGDGLLDQEFLAVFAGLDPAGPYDVITRGIVALGYEVGPRTSELVMLDVADYRIAMVEGLELGPVIALRRPAKTSPARTLPLGVRADDYIREAIGNRTSGPLFPGRDGRQMTVRAMRDRLSRAGKRAGLILHPQRLRRTAASWQGAYGATSGHLDRVFGWEPDPRDVKSGHYIIPTVPQLLHAHQERLSPLDRLELRLTSKGRGPLR